jgi:hypothetical protein
MVYKDLTSELIMMQSKNATVSEKNIETHHNIFIDHRQARDQ